jgi:glycosyltransferase involved in cell wall biosynthesis
MSDPRISVVLPVYNQADHIGPVIDGYRTALESANLSFELLPVINGKRKDDSADICRALSAQHPSIRTHVIDEGGWGRAVRHGLAQARGEILCFTNSARTTADDLLLLLLYGVTHPDVVVKANRRIRESLRRRAGSLLYNLECRALFDLSAWDVNGTPKVFSRRFEPLLHLTRNDDLIDLEFNAICRREGYRIIEVPLFSTTRTGGRSTTNYGSALKMYVGAWRLKRDGGGGAP